MVKTEHRRMRTDVKRADGDKQSATRHCSTSWCSRAFSHRFVTLISPNWSPRRLAINRSTSVLLKVTDHHFDNQSLITTLHIHMEVKCTAMSNSHKPIPISALSPVQLDSTELFSKHRIKWYNYSELIGILHPQHLTSPDRKSIWAHAAKESGKDAEKQEERATDGGLIPAGPSPEGTRWEVPVFLPPLWLHRRWLHTRSRTNVSRLNDAAWMRSSTLVLF